VLEPDVGRMACGEKGKGRLSDVIDITAHTLKALTDQDLAGTRVLVSLGPTREYFDPARFWSNPSTGLMGASLAMAAWLRGASVTVVQGPVDLWLPGSIQRLQVQTAREMYAACMEHWPHNDLGFMTAAISDFSPVPHGAEKFKKRSLESEQFSLPFSTNPDILKAMGQVKTSSQKLLGFCAETSQLTESAAFKLKEKNCDIMVANSIAAPGSGFASSTNTVCVVDSSNRSEQWPALPKAEVSWRLLEWITRILT